MRLKKNLLALLFVLVALPAYAQNAPGGLPYFSGTTPSLSNLNSIVAYINNALGYTGGVVAGGVATGPTTFSVTSYGAVCDGAIVNGVQTTSGSPNISIASVTPTSNQYTDYQFTSADIGKIITINQGQFNTPTAPTNNFSGTILSVSNGVATLSTNATFTSSNYLYATARLYKTDNKAAIQAALDAGHAVGGGKIVFPAGVCATSGPLTFYNNQTIQGAGSSATFVMLAKNSNSDMFVGQNFASLTNTGASSGVVGFIFQDIGLDGNKYANTGSGPGLASGIGDGIKFFGSSYFTNHVIIQNFANDGWFSEFNDGAGDALNNNVSLNAHAVNLQFGDNNGWGIAYAGPHDSFFEDVDFTNNTTGGIIEYGYHQLNAHSNGGPINLNNVHAYQNGTDAVLGGGVSGERVYFEGSTTFNSLNYGFTDSALGTLNLGTATATSVYGLTFTNTSVTTLVNTFNTGGNGFNDDWLGGSIGTITGTYKPNFAYGVKGLPSYVGIFGTTLTFQSNTSYPVTMGTNGGSLFSVTNGGVNFMVADALQKVAFGPSVAATVANEELAVTGAIGSAGNVSTNTKFTTTGCSVSATTGGATAGTYTSGTTGTCTVVITMNGATGLTAPNGWTCYANDQTTPADKLQTTTSSTTTATISGTTVTGDVISFACTGY